MYYLVSVWSDGLCVFGDVVNRLALMAVGHSCVFGCVEFTLEVIIVWGDHQGPVSETVVGR